MGDFESNISFIKWREYCHNEENFIEWLGFNYTTEQIWNMTDNDKVSIRHKFLDETRHEIME